MGVAIGPLYVRRSILIDAPPARVWQEFADLERIQSWLGIGQSIHEYELKVGATVKLSVDIAGVSRYFGGDVVLVEPNQELTFESQWQAPSDWPVPTYWTIKLTPAYSGTVVEIIHHGFERLGESAADNLEGYEQGWTVQHLSALREMVAQET